MCEQSPRDDQTALRTGSERSFTASQGGRDPDCFLLVFALPDKRAAVFPRICTEISRAVIGQGKTDQKWLGRYLTGSDRAAAPGWL
ncbi:hypothetical protein EMIT047CA2_150116 [Pseudomonas soli]